MRPTVLGRQNPERGAQQLPEGRTCTQWGERAGHAHGPQSRTPAGAAGAAEGLPPTCSSEWLTSENASRKLNYCVWCRSYQKR